MGGWRRSSAAGQPASQQLQHTSIHLSTRAPHCGEAPFLFHFPPLCPRAQRRPPPPLSCLSLCPPAGHRFCCSGLGGCPRQRRRRRRRRRRCCLVLSCMVLPCMVSSCRRVVVSSCRRPGCLSVVRLFFFFLFLSRHTHTVRPSSAVAPAILDIAHNHTHPSPCSICHLHTRHQSSARVLHVCPVRPLTCQVILRSVFLYSSQSQRKEPGSSSGPSHTQITHFRSKSTPSFLLQKIVH